MTLDERDDERYGCVHCDAELDPAELRWVAEAELDGVGYAVWAEREHCGRPDCGGGAAGASAMRMRWQSDFAMVDLAPNHSEERSP